MEGNVKLSRMTLIETRREKEREQPKERWKKKKKRREWEGNGEVKWMDWRGVASCVPLVVMGVHGEIEGEKAEEGRHCLKKGGAKIN